MSSAIFRAARSSGIAAAGAILVALSLGRPVLAQALDMTPPALGSLDLRGTGADDEGTAAATRPAQPAARRDRTRRLKPTNARTTDRARVPRVGPPPLPPLQPYPAARLRASGATIDTIDPPGPTVAALPVETRTRPKVEPSPYDPVGVALGPLRLTPYVSQSIGYDSNPDQLPKPAKGSLFSRTEGGTGVLGTWSAAEVQAALHAGYNDYISDAPANRPDAAGTIRLKVDATRETSLDAEQHFAVDTQRPTSPEVGTGVTRDRPLITTFGTLGGGTETWGRTSLALHGTFDRTAYDNAVSSSGVVTDLANGNFNTYGLHLRGGYEPTAAFRPFADLVLDRRVHDATTDLSGFRRDSDGLTGQVGAALDFDTLLTGEVSGGYGRRRFDDQRLKAIDGPVLNGALTYAVTPLTSILLRGSTSFDETTVAGASGARTRSATLEIDHQLLRNLAILGSVTYLDTQYVGAPITETSWAETVKAEYHLSRELVATASYTHQNLHSTQAGSSFDQNVMLIGLKLQR